MGLCNQLGHEYSSNDENLLVAISRQLATTIEKVRLYEETCRAYEDLRRTQEQLLQSEKMSAVGQLIAGVAHELNNPLTAILGYAQLLESEGLNTRAQDYVGKLFKQAQRTHRVVQNLLSFARQRKPQRDEVDLRKVLEETLALRDYDLKTNNIKVELESPSQPTLVVADPHQIEQVFLNIINNSVDAIMETGRNGQLKIRIFCQGGLVCTQFRDDGDGIKDPKRIFDPFYTTKSVARHGTRPPALAMASSKNMAATSPRTMLPKVERSSRCGCRPLRRPRWKLKLRRPLPIPTRAQQQVVSCWLKKKKPCSNLSATFWQARAPPSSPRKPARM